MVQQQLSYHGSTMVHLSPMEVLHIFLQIPNIFLAFCICLFFKTSDNPVLTVQTSNDTSVSDKIPIDKHVTLSAGGSCFSRYFRSLEWLGGTALSLACFSFSNITDAVGAWVNGLGKCLSSSDTS